MSRLCALLVADAQCCSHVQVEMDSLTVSWETSFHTGQVICVCLSLLFACLAICFHLGHVQAHTQAQRFATFSGLNEMFPGNGVQRGLTYVFSCLVGVSKMSVQSAATCK